MATKRFMIAPFEDGLETDVKPWLISDSAFARMQNAYLYYGVVRKRFGGLYMNPGVNPIYGQLYSRLGMQLDTTDGAGNAAFVTPGPGEIGQIFGVGPDPLNALNHEIFTIISNAAGPQPMLATGTGTGTFDFGTGATVITGSIANAPVYWYPALPVMGLPTYIKSANDEEELLGMDTQWIYIFEDRGNGRRWELLDPATQMLSFFTGGNADFFWTANYRGILAQNYVLFMTNGVDFIRSWNGTTITAFIPKYTNNAADIILSANLITSFKNRIILINPLASQGGGPPIRFANRIRYSQIGNPFDVNAFNTETNQQGGASFIDLSTSQTIISVSSLKDRLIIFCEESTWELVFTNNVTAPFIVQRINNELGVESPFSTVLFDKAVLGVGMTGIHACNGTNVERIDEKIRQTIFQINNDNDGPDRVYGIRDYANELVYWSYPDEENNPTFPTKVLVYNYRKGSWAINDDSITVFGNFLVPQDLQWQQVQIQWQVANFAWNNANQQARFRSIIAGNQEGFTFVVSTDISRNAAVLSITNIDFTTPNLPLLTIIDHNLEAGQFILIENVFGTNINDFNNTIFQVIAVIDKDTIRISRNDTAGQAYDGGGVVTRVSRIDVLTKQFNFFQQDGRNAYIPKVDFNVDRTANGEIAIDYFTSTSSQSLVTSGTNTGTLLGTAVLETTPYLTIPYELLQTQLWHTIYLQAEGEYVQVRIYLNDDQMFDRDVALEDFELNGMIFYADPTSTRLQ